jgi:hypothetical protein
VYEKAISMFKIKSRDFAASLVAIIAWTLVNLVLISKIIPIINFALVLAISSAGVIIFYFLFYNYPSVGVHRHSTTRKANLARFLISGFIVAMSGIFAKFLGPTWGGLVASFPVTIAVGLYFLDKSQSDNFTKYFVKNKHSLQLFNIYNRRLCICIYPHKAKTEVIPQNCKDSCLSD